MSRFSVIYDACIFYPAPLRDILVELARLDMFKARWTDQIHEEWINSLLKKREDLDRGRLDKTRQLIDTAVLDCKVKDYEEIIESLALPDPDDKHVLAAAIKSKSDAIVTFNLRDFPEPILSRYEVEVIHPDDFIYYQIDMDSGKVCSAIKAIRDRLRNPAKTLEEYISTLRRQQLPQTAQALEKYIALI